MVNVKPEAMITKRKRFLLKKYRQQGDPFLLHDLHFSNHFLTQGRKFPKVFPDSGCPLHENCEILYKMGLNPA